MIYKPDQYYFSQDQMTPSYDPVGLLGSINSIVVVFLGLQAGKILVHYSDMKSRIIRLCIWGCKYIKNGPEMDRKVNGRNLGVILIQQFSNLEFVCG